MSLRFKTEIPGTKTLCSYLLSSSFSAAACTKSSCSPGSLNGQREGRKDLSWKFGTQCRSAKEMTPRKCRTVGQTAAPPVLAPTSSDIEQQWQKLLERKRGSKDGFPKHVPVCNLRTLAFYPSCFCTVIQY